MLFALAIAPVAQQGLAMGSSKPKATCELSPYADRIGAIIKGRVPRGSGGRGPAASVLLTDSGGYIVNIGYEKNANVFQAVASTQKILTAWVAIKKGNLRDQVRFTNNDLFYDQQGSRATLGPGGSKIQPGDQATLYQYLYSLMYQSANGAAHAITRGPATTNTQNFVGLMNQEAADLLRSDSPKSFFQNPSGLTDSDSSYRFAGSNRTQGSTAREMAALAGRMMGNSKFKSQLDKAGLQGTSSGYLYKLGFTQAAGRTVVAHFKHPKSGCQNYGVAIALFGENTSSQFANFQKAYQELLVLFSN